MKEIVKIQFGSHLYGTATEASDLDIKGIYLPSSRDILLQQIKPSINQVRSKGHGEKNTADDLDIEFYSPMKFLQLLVEGQTVALDMLFAPEASLINTPDPVWYDIREIAPKLFSKKAASFLRYCQQQANKYGIKGSRVAAARKALSFLEQSEERYGSSSKLSTVEKEIIELVRHNDHLMVTPIPQAEGKVEYCFEICGKKAMLNASIKNARSIAQRLMNEYGARAIAAEKNEGIDWKALSHAVRVGHQAIEFLSTHHINFPRPEANHLLEIKRGELPFQVVSSEIENLLEEVREAARNSDLPDTPDISSMYDFIETLHKNIVFKGGKL